MPSLKITVKEKEPNVYVATLFGSLDTTTYAQLEEGLQPILTHFTKAIVLNMAGVDYISSMGIGTVFKLTKTMKDNGGVLLVTDLQPQIKKVFDTVKAMPLEAIFSSVEEADEYLKEIQKKYFEQGN